MLILLTGFAVILLYALLPDGLDDAPLLLGVAGLTTGAWVMAAWFERASDWFSRMNTLLAFLLYFIHLIVNWGQLTAAAAFPDGPVAALATVFIALYAVLIPLVLFTVAPIRNWLESR